MFGIKYAATKISNSIESVRTELDYRQSMTENQLASIEVEIENLTNEIRRSNGNFVAADTKLEHVDRVGRIDNELAKKVEDLVKKEMNLPEKSTIVAITPKQVYFVDKPEILEDENKEDDSDE